MQSLQLFPFISTQADTSSLCLKLVLPASQQVGPDIQTPRRLCNLVTLLGYERHRFSLGFCCVGPSFLVLLAICYLVGAV